MWLKHREFICTYLDRCQRLVINVKLEVGVASVVERLAKAAKTFTENLRTDCFLIWVFFHTEFSRCSLWRDNFVRVWSEEVSLAPNLDNSLHEFVFGNLAIVVFIHRIILGLEGLRIVASVLLHHLRDKILALLPVKNVVLIEIQGLEHLSHS